MTGALTPVTVPNAGDSRLRVIEPSAPGVDPTLDIQFIVLAGRWTPVARNGSLRGDETIRLFGLDQPPILELYTPHVQEAVEPIASSVAELVTIGSNSAAQATWNRALVLGDPKSQFAALNRDALTHFVPSSMRQAAGLAWPWTTP
jgi:hypothetical protein